MLQYDVVIHGAGLVGSMHALSLKHMDPGCKILILDKAPMLGNRETLKDYDLRVSAINNSSINKFKLLGLWEDLQPVRHGVFKRVNVYSGSDNSFSISNTDAGQDKLAYVYENIEMLNIMHMRIKQYSNVDYIQTTIEDLDDMGGHVEILLSSGNKLRTSLLVGADGGSSIIRRKAKINTKFFNYDQTAIVGTFTADGENCVAHQTFSQNGILAWLPLSLPGFYSIVLSVSAKDAELLMSLDDNRFVDELKKFDRSFLDNIKLVGKKASFPLRGMHADCYHHGRIVLIGDAAHVIHPLAGQGVNLGFQDAFCLAEKICNNTMSIRHGLRSYESSRYHRNASMQRLMEALHFGFVKTQGIGNYLRFKAFDLIDNSHFLKKHMIRVATG